MQTATVLGAKAQPRPSSWAIKPSGEVIARSAAMREILDHARKIAATSVPVLIQGEVGVGKTAIAREIHRQSRRAAGPFVSVACGSLRESELDEQLSAGSGDCLPAGTARPARLLEASQHGTLFLNDVAQLPLWAQTKLLDILRPNGSHSRENSDLVPTPVRVIASSTCDLGTAVVENRFDSRLYYYLSFVRIDVPPLRHRQEDIRALAEHFLAAAVSMLSAPRREPAAYFSGEAWQCLLHCDWPGNVLQLAAVVSHAVMLAEGPEIRLADVSASLDRARHHPDSEMISVPLAGGLKEMESILINEVVRRCRGNKAAAARVLKLHRRTLYRLLEE